MINLKFKYLAAKNFVCYGPEGIEIEFQNYDNIVLIRGENLDVVNEEERVANNGLGKSSIPAVIVYALFGKTIKSPKKITHKNVINNKIGKNLFVEVQWNNFRVVRTRKPDSLRIWESEERIWGLYVVCPFTKEKIPVKDRTIGETKNSLGQLFTYTEDDVKDTEITLGGMPATQELIEEKLGMNYETFLNIFVFTDNNAGNFLECDGPAKRELVENVLSLDKYRLFFDASKKIKNDYKDKIKLISKSYEHLMIESNACISRISNIEQKEKHWRVEKDKELNNLINNLNLKTNELNSSDQGANLNRYNEAQVKMNSNNETIAAEENRKEKLNSILQEVNNKLDAEREKNNSLKQDVVVSTNKIKELNNNISKLEEEISNLKNNTGKACNQCKSIIKKENYQIYSEEVLKKIDSYKEEIENSKTTIAELTELINNSNTLINKFKENISFGNQKIGESNSNIAVLRKENMKLFSIPKPEAGVNELLLQNQIEEINIQIENKKKEISSPSPFYSILESAKEESFNKEKEVADKLQELKKAEEDLPYYEFWVNAFGDSGIRKFVIDGIIPALNARCAYWLQFLINGKISIAFDNELEEKIERNPSDGDPFVYAAMSSGEQQRLCLAVCLSFAHIMALNTGRVTSCIFLDEVTTNIDPIGVVGIYSVIQELSKEKQVFITTHDQSLLEMLEGCQQLKLQKKDGFTKII